MSSRNSTEPGWGERLGGHLELSRISNLPTVVTNVATGATLAGGLYFDEQTGLLLAAMLLFYFAGMYLNDVFDVGFDRENRPERPIPSGRVSRREAGSVGGFFLVAAVALVVLAAPRALGFALAMAALILVYNSWHHGNPIASWVMGSIRGMIYVTVCYALGGALTLTEVVPAVLLALYIVGLTAMASAETNPERFRYTPAVLLLPPAVYAVVVGGSFASIAMAVLFCAWLGFTLRLTAPDEDLDVGTAISRLLAGICLVDASILAANGAPGLAAAAVAGFALTLAAHQYVAGT